MTVVLQAEPDEKVDLPVWHVHDLLDGFLGLVLVGQKCQFFDEFRSAFYHFWVFLEKNGYTP